MNDKSDLIERANLLIKADSNALADSRPEVPRQLQRRRRFVASDLGHDVAQMRARLAASQSDDDGLPVLTEVVVEHAANPLPDDRASALASLVEQRLAEVLPDLLQAALASAAHQLRQEIEAGVAQTLRDFVSQHAVPFIAPIPGAATDDALAND